MPARIQSPSSINTFKQCPRKYYYQYIAKLPTSPNVHTVRGNVAHKVLELFFDSDVKDVTLKTAAQRLRDILQDLLLKQWVAAKPQFAIVGLSHDQQVFYFEETLFMLFNWLDQFMAKVNSFTNLSFQEIFGKLTPLREQAFLSQQYQVRGFVDVIEQHEGHVCIMDYKTSSSFEISDEYRLQLAIYALMYHDKHGVLPKKAGIYFLKKDAKYISVDEQLLAHAKREIAFVHEQTLSERIDDYSLKPSPLCKWSSGQCDFYGLCFEKKTVGEFVKFK